MIEALPGYLGLSRNLRASVLALLLLVLTPGHTQARDETISFAMRQVPIAEAMEMLARRERVNILLSEEITGDVSFNIYDMTVDEAIIAIADAAGYAVEKRNGNYFIVDRDEAGKYALSELTQVRTFKLQFGDPAGIENILLPYLSSYGKVTVAQERRMISVEDRPEFLDRIAAMLRDLDRDPRQILIEAQILEITLNSEDSYGIDWADLFSSRGRQGELGTQGLADAGSSSTTGFFLTLGDDELDLVLNALEERGQVQTLSTPKLLALENQEASVIIGDRRGFKVTTTINQVTSETIEFLESGVILRVTPQVGVDDTVLLDVHPEVSTGTVDSNGIPSQVTTEVTTQLLVPSGRTVFIGGLMKHTTALNRAGVPVLRRIPGIRRLFSNEELTEVNSETIVLITPRVVNDFNGEWNASPTKKVEQAQSDVAVIVEEIEADNARFGGSKSKDAAAADSGE